MIALQAEKGFLFLWPLPYITGWLHLGWWAAENFWGAEPSGSGIYPGQKVAGNWGWIPCILPRMTTCSPCFPLLRALSDPSVRRSEMTTRRVIILILAREHRAEGTGNLPGTLGVEFVQRIWLDKRFKKPKTVAGGLKPDGQDLGFMMFGDVWCFSDPQATSVPHAMCHAVQAMMVILPLLQVDDFTQSPFSAEWGTQLRDVEDVDVNQRMRMTAEVWCWPSHGVL